MCCESVMRFRYLKCPICLMLVWIDWNYSHAFVWEYAVTGIWLYPRMVMLGVWFLGCLVHVWLLVWSLLFVQMHLLVVLFLICSGELMVSFFSWFSNNIEVKKQSACSIHFGNRSDQYGAFKVLLLILQLFTLCFLFFLIPILHINFDFDLHSLVCIYCYDFIYLASFIL